MEMGMKLDIKKPPREFKPSKNHDIIIKDFGRIFLEENEQITFISDKNKEYDVVKKKWGFYATPSINDRLKKNGYKTAYVKNQKGQTYIMLVELNKLKIFQEYIEKTNQTVIYWLDEI